MATPEEKARDAGPPKVFAVGMLRTGTYSLAAALSELGFKHVFHGLNSRTKPTHWAFFERAAITTWPEVNAKGQSAPTPFSREDWDELFGPYDAVTDLSCFWALQLIDAYPEAKIILTERDFDKWFPSFDSQVIQPLFGPWVDLFLKGVGIVIGNRAGFAMQKTLSGFFGGARTIEELHRRAPEVFREHSERIKAHVAPERLLVYRVGEDGWEPLCEFLGKEVPKGKAFPTINDKASHTESDRVIRRTAWIQAARTIAPYSVAITAAYVGHVYWSRIA
ncbi:hypothetical protein BDP55DRAFT_662157 [Colletotrichum godetiae]|uniref:Efflux pump antibiotic resistance protein n=1 Tax=Colletotrichum godetiae TaxID=1209918 RepID=A0AAJ0EWD9_9PEZI|nr:uncharacterized protein BDP55DRAFT_662157 [Colletotrichum godetiae]KAK1676268.1 hypothetical protein BDP55DRAFT_662157 [Colletotrichum godetiae]